MCYQNPSWFHTPNYFYFWPLFTLRRAGVFWFFHANELVPLIILLFWIDSKSRMNFLVYGDLACVNWENISSSCPWLYWPLFGFILSLYFTILIFIIKLYFLLGMYKLYIGLHYLVLSYKLQITYLQCFS